MYLWVRGQGPCMLESILAAVEPYRSEAILLLKLVGIVIGTVLTARFFDRLLKSRLENRFKSASKEMEISRTSYTLLKRFMNAGIYIMGAALLVHTIPGLRQISYALFASAGFLGIVVGFAAQEAFSNIISGIFIAIFNPFRVGDKIEASAQYGTVEDITLRHTVIKTPDNERVIVPNTKIVNDNIKNYSIIDEKSRFRVEIPISYHDDIDQAKEIILEEADAHELTQKGESSVIIKNLADSGVLLELRLWSHDRADAWQAGTDLRETIKQRFDEEDITIPFPQRTISYLDGDGKHLKGD